MARQELMNWDEKNLCWQRMHAGKNWRVSCGKGLGLPRDQWTMEKSRAAANLWWERKQADLAPPISQAAMLMQAVGGQSVMEDVATKYNAMAEVWEMMNDQEAIPPDAFQRLLGQAAVVNPPATPNQDIDGHRQTFLAIIASKVKPKSYNEIDKYLNRLALPPLDKINETTVENIYLDLSRRTLKMPTKKKWFAFAKRFLAYLAEKKLIAMPANLYSRLLSFRVDPQAVKSYDTQAVKETLANLPERFRLYAMLGLNCGMTQVDIAKLDKAQLRDGYLTRKRVKTEKEKNVPTVTYKLWPETIALLARHQANHPTLVLTSTRNTPLWDYRTVGGKVKQKDLIGRQWQLEATATMPLKAFRSVAATLIRSNPVYGPLAGLFLGHAPATMGEKFYFANHQGIQDQFDACMDWLRTQLT